MVPTVAPGCPGVTVGASMSCSMCTPLYHLSRDSHVRRIQSGKADWPTTSSFPKESLISLQTTLNQLYNKVTKHILRRHAQTQSPAEKTGERVCLVCSVSLVHRTVHFRGWTTCGHTPCHPAVVLLDAGSSLTEWPAAKSGSSMSWKAESFETQPTSCCFSKDSKNARIIVQQSAKCLLQLQI